MKNNFEEKQKNDKPVLIDFHADWCGPCQTMETVFKEIKADFGESIDYLKVDIDENKNLAVKMGIKSVPTTMLFKNGKRVWRKSGLISKNDLKMLLKRY